MAQLVATTFADMIFIHGDVHCDPHAANMLVRRAPAPAPTPTPSGSGSIAGGGASTSGRNQKADGSRRRRVKGEMQLVILDHGLYRRISDSFR